MNHLVVYAHPNPESFNHAILETVVQSLQGKGHVVTVRDLYAIGLDPVLKFDGKGEVSQEVITEQEFISKADAVTFIYPIWWTGMPAILKGYIDRVYSYGFAYQYNAEGGIDKLLSGKKGLIINTHGTPKEIYDSIGMTEALIKTSTTGVFEFCGIESVGHLTFGSVPSVDDTARKEMLEEIKNEVNSLFE
ncbi:NAD(P)H-dependent oxidoreductase [Niallia taxi]|nr:NAD(P)H-dependent oxidoreductase [Niallia taxi]MDE5052712.1 NAD(P)H-dependent oxidoreductase [Niallia taxi]